MNYYPHHIGDFNNATRDLDRIERSVYRDLIEYYYDTESPIPEDFDYICRKVLAKSNEERSAVEYVLKEYFTLTDKGYENSRCNKVIKDYQKQKKTASKAGKASAKARKAKKKAESKPLEKNERPLNDRCDYVAPTKTNNQNQEPITTLRAAGEVLPCKDGNYTLNVAQLCEWQEAYPDVKIDQEILKIKAWLNSNQPKLKTVKGMPRFINNWLNNAKPEVEGETHKQDFISLHTNTEWANDL